MLHAGFLDFHSTPSLPSPRRAKPLFGRVFRVRLGWASAWGVRFRVWQLLSSQQLFSLRKLSRLQALHWVWLFRLHKCHV